MPRCLQDVSQCSLRDLFPASFYVHVDFELQALHAIGEGRNGDIPIPSDPLRILNQCRRSCAIIQFHAWDETTWQAHAHAIKQANTYANEQACKHVRKQASKQARISGSHARTQASRQASKQASRQASQYANNSSKQASKHASKQANTQIIQAYASKQANKYTNKQTSKQANKQASKHANKQASKQADKQTSPPKLFKRCLKRGHPLVDQPGIKPQSKINSN